MVLVWVVGAMSSQFLSDVQMFPVLEVESWPIGHFRDVAPVLPRDIYANAPIPK